MRRPPEIGDIVAVEWLDAWFDPDEVKPSDWKEEMRVTTFGELGRLGAVVTVIGETHEDGMHRAITHVPEGMVQSIRILKRRKD